MSREPFASDQQIIGITQDVWGSFTGKAIQPAAGAVALDGGHIAVGCVAVSGQWQGCVLLACPRRLARAAAAAMFGLSAAALTDAEVADAVGELTNVICGNIKSLLPGPSRLSMPRVSIRAADAVRMPAVAPANSVWLTCEGLPLIVGVWPGPLAWPCGDGTDQ